MTLKELSKILGKSEKTLIYCFGRTQKNLKKKGINIIKIGRGKNAQYEIKYDFLGGQINE